MCGIAGIYRVKTGGPVSEAELRPMVNAIAHRGPDSAGFFTEQNIGLGSRRLSIIDIPGGAQPVYNEDKSICIVFNGEIFNYIELREQLIKKGHRFSTSGDTETIVHAYEEYGPDFTERLNGQFAFALWDSRKKELLLARDRIGIIPLFYTILQEGTLLFASEIKGLFASHMVRPELDPCGIKQVFSKWVNIPPRTVFKNINELPPATVCRVCGSGIVTKKYWDYKFPDMGAYEDRPLRYYTDRLEELLYDSVKIRLRSDVPVASYLSGGLDSSIITALAKKAHNSDLVSFSVGFREPDFDESPWQMEAVKHIKTDHRMTEADADSIGRFFSDVVYHCEKPLMRTAPSPLYLLSNLVHQNGIKVVLTGEGADEFFGGYNIFKEDKIRRFMARVPESPKRPELLKLLYPYVARNSRGNVFWTNFFKKGFTATDNRYYSHQIRWDNTSQIQGLFNDDFLSGCTEPVDELDSYLSDEMMRWHPLSRAQYLEAALFLPGYLLSSQGDRMLMAHSVEGRFPFLDHRVIEFAATIPPEYKIRGLNEKYVLKKTFESLLPRTIIHRQKKPYRAPVAQCLIDRETIASSMLEKDIITGYGYFDPDRVELLMNKYRKHKGSLFSERDDMSIAAIVSTHLLHYHFIERNI